MKLVGRVMSVGALGLALSASAVGGLPSGAVAPAPVSVSYTCSLPGLGSYTGAVNVAANIPATVKLKGKVTLTGVQMSVTVPASLVNEAISFGLTKVSGTVTTADITATDATVPTVNATATPKAFGPVKLVANQPLTVKFPKSPARVGTWSPAGPGTMTFSTGDVAISAFGQTVSCSPAGADVLGSTTVP